MVASVPAPDAPACPPNENAPNVTLPAVLSITGPTGATTRPVLPRNAPSDTPLTWTMAGSKRKSVWKPARLATFSTVRVTVNAPPERLARLVAGASWTRAALGGGVLVGVGIQVGVGVKVRVIVGVFVGVRVSVGVTVGVSVGIRVAVGVLAGVNVTVGVRVGVRVTVGVSVGVRVTVGVSVGVRVTVGVCVGARVSVGVVVGVGVITDVGLAVIVGVASGQAAKSTSSAPTSYP